MNSTINTNPTHPTSNVNEQQPSSQHEQTGGMLGGVPVSYSGSYKPTPAQVKNAGFLPLKRQSQVNPEKGTNTSDQEALGPLNPSIETSAPPLYSQSDYKITEAKGEEGGFFTKVPVALPEAEAKAMEPASGIEATPLPISYFKEQSKQLRNLAMTYRINGAQDKAKILDLQADFLDGQDRQAHLKQSFDFPMGYPHHGGETFRDGRSLYDEYSKGAQYCQSFLNHYQKNPNKKAAIMGYAKNLNDYCECLNKVSQELEKGFFYFDTSENAKKLLAQSKQVDQDSLYLETLLSCSIS
jgi:hypothetical protein